MHFHVNLFKAKEGGARMCVYVAGRGEICQIMHNCSIVALISTSSSVLRGH